MSSAVVSEMLIRIAADTAQLRSEMDQAKRAIGGSFDEIKGMASNLKTTLMGLFAGLGAAKLTEEFIKTGDAMQMLEARLKNTVGAGEDFAKAQKEIYRIAQANNIGIQEATTLFTKMNEPVKRLGGTVHETAGIVEAFSLSLRLGGANTQEAAAATLQFGQAMGSGKLQGDEFRSMAEASPRFMKALAEGMNVPIEQLKKMGSEGKLTADVVGNALIKSLDQLKSEAGNLPDTVSGAFQRMKNDVSVMVDELNKNSGLTLGLAGMIELLRTDVLPIIKNELAGAFEAVGGWIESNRAGLTKVWDTIKAAAGDAWELVKAVVAGLKPIGDWLVQSGALKTVFEGIRFVIAAITDGVNMIAAAIKLISGDAEGAKKIWDNFKDGKTAIGALNAELAANKTASEQSAAATQQAGSAASESSGAFKVLKNSHTELTEEQKKALEAYKKLIDGIRDKTGALMLELEQESKLTDAQKTALKVMQDIQNGSIKLTDAQKKEVAAALEHLIATEKLNAEREAEKRLRDALARQREEDAKAAMKEAESVEKELEAQQKANDALRYTKKELSAVEAARLNERIAIMEQVVAQDQLIGACTKETAAHEATLEALKKLKAAREEGVYLEAAKEAADEWKKTSDSIRDNLTDALMRGFESGKGFMQNFRDTLKNLFNTLVLRPIIQPIAQGASSALMSMIGMSPTGASASTGGGFGNALSTLSSLYQGGKNFLSGATINSGMAGAWTRAGDWMATSSNNTMAGIGDWMQANGQIGSYLGMAGNTFAGYGIGKFANSTISGQYSVGKGFNTVADIGSAIAGAMFGPIGGAIVGGIAGLVNRAFGMGPKEIRDSGITGTLSGGNVNAQNFSDWFQKGGWFRSNRSGTNYSALSSEMQDGLQSGASLIYQQTKAWAEALKLPGESLANITKQFRITFGSDDEKNKAAIAQLMNDYQSELVNQFAGFLEPFRKEGEKLADTMKRLVIIEDFSNSIRDLGGVFAKVADSSFNARQSLIEMSGGIDNLVGQINQFVSDYYTEAEKSGLQAKAIADALKAVGIDASGLMTREDYRALVESRDVNTEAGRQQLSLLLQLGPQFAQLADYLKQQGLNVEAAIQDAPTNGVLAKMVDPAQTTATAVTSMAASVDQSNTILSGISNKLSSIADTSNNAASAAQAAVQAAQAAVKAAQDAVSAASLITSAPTYQYNIGGN